MVADRRKRIEENGCLIEEMKGRVDPGPSGPPGDEVTGPGRASKVEKAYEDGFEGIASDGENVQRPVGGAFSRRRTAFSAFSGAAAGGGRGFGFGLIALSCLLYHGCLLLVPIAPLSTAGKVALSSRSCRNRRGILLDRGLHPRSGGYPGAGGGRSIRGGG